MSKTEPPFGRPKSPVAQDLPGHLKGRPKTAKLLQNATLDDFVWLGDEGALDHDEAVAQLHALEALLQHVLRAVISAYPGGDATFRKRLRSATKALTRRPPPVGRTLSMENEALLDIMALQYLSGFYDLQPAPNSFNALANEVLEQDPDYAGSDNPEYKSGRRTRLCEGFEKRKDELLARLTMAQEERRIAVMKINRVIDALRDLGIAAEPIVINDLKSRTDRRS